MLSETQIIAKISTMERRIKTQANINIFDRALIIADLFGISKEDAFEQIFAIREEVVLQ